MKTAQVHRSAEWCQSWLCTIVLSTFLSSGNLFYFSLIKHHFKVYCFRSKIYLFRKKGVARSLNPRRKSWLKIIYIQQLMALFAWPNKNPVVCIPTGIPQGPKMSLKSCKNKLRYIKNQHSAKARTTVINIFNTFFLDLFKSRTFAGVALPGMCLAQTLTIMIEYKTAITKSGNAYSNTKETMV